MKLGVCVLCRWAFFHAVGQRVIISSCQECKEFPVRSSSVCESKETMPTHVTALHRITSLADCGNGPYMMKTKLSFANLETADREKGIAEICLCSSCFVYQDFPVHFCFCALRFPKKTAVNQTSVFLERQALVDLVFCHLLSAGF